MCPLTVNKHSCATELLQFYGLQVAEASAVRHVCVHSDIRVNETVVACKQRPPSTKYKAQPAFTLSIYDVSNTQIGPSGPKEMCSEHCPSSRSLIYFVKKVLNNRTVSFTIRRTDTHTHTHFAVDCTPHQARTEIWFPAHNF
jgi:hypothetical protein